MLQPLRDGSNSSLVCRRLRAANDPRSAQEMSLPPVGFQCLQSKQTEVLVMEFLRTELHLCEASLAREDYEHNMRNVDMKMKAKYDMANNLLLHREREQSRIHLMHMLINNPEIHLRFPSLLNGLARRNLVAAVLIEHASPLEQVMNESLGRETRVHWDCEGHLVVAQVTLERVPSTHQRVDPGFINQHLAVECCEERGVRYSMDTHARVTLLDTLKMQDILPQAMDIRITVPQWEEQMRWAHRSRLRFTGWMISSS
jgi:hypothetical protein